MSHRRRALILTSGDADDLKRAWFRAQLLLDPHEDELTFALERETRRLVLDIEGDVIEGSTFDLDGAVEDHEGRVRRLIEYNTQNTGESFGRSVLEDSGQESRLDEWITASLMGLAVTQAAPAAGRFAKWTRHHVLRALDRPAQARGLLLRLRGDQGRTRARNAASVEVHTASQRATQDVAAFTGNYDTRVWCSRLDGAERATHAEAHGQRVRLTESYTVGGYQLRFPSDPRGPIHETANCRCVSALQRGKKP